MRRRALLAGLILAVMLALAACGGDDKKPSVPPTGEPTDEVGQGPDIEETEEPTGDVVSDPIEPGLQVRKGLTVLRESNGFAHDRAYFFAEVRNDTENFLAQVDVILNLLDEGLLPLRQISANPLVSDIPPGQTFLVGAAFTPPEGFTDSKRWIWFEPTQEPVLQGYFDLPVTIESESIIEGGYYSVRGTVDNNTGVMLAFPVVDVALIGPDDDLVGLDHAVVTLDAPDNTWPPGEQARFEVLIGFIAVEPELVSGVQVMATGYALPVYDQPPE